MVVEEDDYLEEDLFCENEKEVVYNEDIDWEMDDDSMYVIVSLFRILYF